jgi:hypothetical protein
MRDLYRDNRDNRNGLSMPETAPSTPAARFISRFGVKRLAAWTGRHSSRVHSWAWPTNRGGTGGVIPTKVRAKIIDGAKADLGEDLTYSEFEPGIGEAYLPDEAPAAEPVP